MSSNFLDRTLAKPSGLALSACLALTLAACGGGGGSPGAVPGPPPPVVVPPVVIPPVVIPATPKAIMTISDGTGKALTSLSGGQSANVRVTVFDTKGVPVPNEIVKFNGDALVTFTPEAASALTDINGVAVIQVKPANNTSAGAAGVTATVVVAGQTATATVNLSIGASPLLVSAISAVGAPPSLPAFGTVPLSIPLTLGGQPATISTGLTISSLCTGDGLATIVLGSLSGGVQTATYTNNGCTRGTDVITASVGNSVQTTSIGVGTANIGTIQFVGSDLQGRSIVLKGSSGLGRQESALLTFRVLDQNNQGLAGVDVDFTASTSTGGLTVAPARGTTDATGRVSTTVSAGTIPTPVRVFAQATRNGRTLSGLSDTVTISTGLPIQKSMSLSVQSYNIEGWQRDGISTNVTVRLADQYGNPISDDTAVSFVAEGGAIGSALRGACVTLDGGCTVQFRSQEFRPANGRVTILAYVQGLENFIDANGDGQYSCTSTSSAPGTVYRPLIDTCFSGGEAFVDQGDPFLDAGLIGEPIVPAVNAPFRGLDDRYDPANGDLPVPYNRTTYSAVGNNAWGLNYIWRSAEITLSGSNAFIKRQFCDAEGNCRDWVAATDGVENQIATSTSVAGGSLSCAPATVMIRVFDLHNNPMPHESTLSIVDADQVSTGTMSPNKVPTTNDIGGTIHTFTVKADPLTCATGSFGVLVTAPSGTGRVFQFKTI